MKKPTKEKVTKVVKTAEEIVQDFMTKNDITIMVDAQPAHKYDFVKKIVMYIFNLLGVKVVISAKSVYNSELEKVAQDK